MNFAEQARGGGGGVPNFQRRMANLQSKLNKICSYLAQECSVFCPASQVNIYISEDFD
jgi:hypothetical protein